MREPEMIILAQFVGRADKSEARFDGIEFIEPDFLARSAIGAGLMRNPG